MERDEVINEMVAVWSTAHYDDNLRAKDCIVAALARAKELGWELQRERGDDRGWKPIKRQKE